MRLGILASSIFLSALLAAALQAAPPTSSEVRFFETKIRPLLAESCYQCHGRKKQTSGLRLDSLSAILRGGDAGPAIVPGKPAESLLITAVSYRDSDLQMPPEKRLSARQVADLTRWVMLGAPHPDAATVKPAARGKIDIEQGRKFWAFQPPREPRLPAVNDTSWPQSPIDFFILAKLETAGLKAPPPADKRTLIRRVTFDLTGLPPDPEDVEAFVNDASPVAFAKVVDRLLASPGYGERWGRHWLDVARYADSNGLDENVAHGNAWRYRDYVVAALNGDKPYDQFVLEQLAGDLLDGGKAKDERTRIERLVATGFLSLGPKVLAEVDERKMELDIVDEQVDTVGRAFMGLTLGCARCHDHKFDPIPTRDYYSLAGIFKSTRTMESFKKVARWHENTIATRADLARKADHDRRAANVSAEIDRLVKQASEQAKAAAAARGNEELPKDIEPLFPAEVRMRLAQLREKQAALKKSVPQLPTAMGVTDGQIADTHVHVRGSHLTMGAPAPRRFPQVMATGRTLTQFPIGKKQSGRLQLARWLISRDHPLTARVMANRLWRWRFGAGLVRTPDNFGRLGERPTHPRLLDWLACRLMNDAWSLKALHRRMLLSATYQMSSRHDPAAAKQDPENRLLWRARIRRLEAEAIRDAILAVSGSLDRRMGGSLLHVENRGYFFDHTSKDTTDYRSARRSLYLPVVRNHLYDVFQIFDYSDASVLSGNRTSSTVAPQALFMLNSDLLAQASGNLAGVLLADAEARDEERIHRLYSRAYGRPPREEEVTRAIAFLHRIEQRMESNQKNARARTRGAWALLCNMVLAANEFVYLR